MPYMDWARLTDYRQPFTTERFFYLFINIIIIFYYTTNHMTSSYSIILLRNDTFWYSFRPNIVSDPQLDFVGHGPILIVRWSTLVRSSTVDYFVYIDN